MKNYDYKSVKSVLNRKGLTEDEKVVLVYIYLHSRIENDFYEMQANIAALDEDGEKTYLQAFNSLHERSEIFYTEGILIMHDPD